MNYIIFGGTGFVGTHLAKLIKSSNPDAKIFNLDIVKQGDPLPSVKDYKPALCKGEEHPAEYIHCDVRKSIHVDFEPTSEDIIFNFAAVHRTPGHEDFEYFDTNVNGAQNVTDFAERYGIKSIVFSSSIAVYGASEDLKSEDSLPTSMTSYGTSKLQAESIHMTWQAKDPERRLLIVRPGVVFGKGENGNFTRLHKAIKTFRFAYPGRKDTIKACMYVKELVNFIMWYIKNPVRDVDVYNCTFEPAFTISQICNAMKRATNLNRFILLIPSWILMPAAAVIGVLGAPMGICPARVKKLMASTNISGKKLASSGYVFKYTFEEALKDWFKDNDNVCLE